jgi:putative AlgH/UPF0301 family transcriptional regulator
VTHSITRRAPRAVVLSVRVQARVDAGSLRADAISFYSGYAAWPIARLADEVAAGTWHVAVAPSDHLLHHARKGTLSAARLRDNMI